MGGVNPESTEEASDVSIIIVRSGDDSGCISDTKVTQQDSDMVRLQP